MLLCKGCGISLIKDGMPTDHYLDDLECLTRQREGLLRTLKNTKERLRRYEAACHGACQAIKNAFPAMTSAPIENYVSGLEGSVKGLIKFRLDVEARDPPPLDACILTRVDSREEQ